MQSELVQKILDKLKTKTAQNAYRITIDTNAPTGVFDSKFGGVPYWDLQKPYPQDTNGNKLALLAQFNFDKDKVSEPLPTKGMLQFFIRVFDDDIYGADFDNPTKQDGFRVIYHENIDTSVTEAQIKALDIPWDIPSFDDFPLAFEMGITITPTQICMGTLNEQFNHVFCEIASEVLQKDIQDMPYYKILTEQEQTQLLDALPIGGHSLLGHPFFTQYDPRENDETLSAYTTLLFQMDSEYDRQEDYVMWGDGGVANFFIKPQDLQNKKFDDILYNWDCY